MSIGSKNSTNGEINIYARDSKVGKLNLFSDGSCKIIYDNDWKINGFALSPALPLSGLTEPNAEVNFLKNIFPEGEGFQELLDFNRVSKNNLHAILTVIGHDTSGGLVFANEPPKTQFKNLRRVTEKELINKLDKNSTRELIFWDGKYRLSVAGVQNKLNVLIDNKYNMYLADGQYASTDILKFASIIAPHITINEYFCMELANLIGLPVAKVDLKILGKHYVLIVKRFDRIFVKDKVLKAHVVDGCQVLNLPPSHKYEQNFGSQRDVKHIRDGTKFKGLFEFTENCSIPVLDKKSILDWLLFNVLIGNSDAHGKNISFFVGKNLYKLAPFYDLLSIVYEAENNDRLDIGLAMAIGDQFDINKITAFDLLCLCDEVGLSFKLLKARMTFILANTVESLERMNDIASKHDDVVKRVFYDLKKIINVRCSLLMNELNQLDEVRKSAF